MEITYQKANSVVKQFLTEHPSELCNSNTISFALLFPKYYSRNNKFGIQNKSLVDLAYSEWIYDIKNNPQVAKDRNNYNKPERNINEFEQVPIKEKESSPPLQKFFMLLQKNNSKKKNIEINKAKEQMDLKQERKRKSLDNKKINREKRLKANNKDMEKTGKKNCQYIVNKYIDYIFFAFLIGSN